MNLLLSNFGLTTTATCYTDHPLQLFRFIRIKRNPEGKVHNLTGPEVSAPHPKEHRASVHCVPHPQTFAATLEAKPKAWGQRLSFGQGSDPALDNPAPSPDQMVCA